MTKEYTVAEAEKLNRWKMRFKDPNFHEEVPAKLLKFVLTFQFTLSEEVKTIRTLITADSGIYNDVFVREKFPIEVQENSVRSHFLDPIAGAGSLNTLLSPVPDRWAYGIKCGLHGEPAHFQELRVLHSQEPDGEDLLCLCKHFPGPLSFPFFP